MRTCVAALLVCLGLFLAYPQMSAPQWVQTSGPEGCHVVSLAGAGNKVFAVVEGYGLFTSSDNGARWTAVKTGLPPGHDVTLVEWINATLFAGTDRGLVLFSTDDGAKWRRIEVGPPGAGRPAVNSLALAGTDLFIGTHNGVYLCSDYADGAAAVPLELPKGTLIRSFAVIGSDVIAGQLRGPILLFKKNIGAWTRSEFPSPVHWELICLEASGSDLFAGTGEGIFLSSDRGASWSKIGQGLRRDPYVTCLGLSGLDIVAGLSEQMVPEDPPGIRVSRGRGRVWTATHLGLKNADIECFGSGGKSLFAGTTSGVFRSQDGGSTWMPANAGLPVASSVLALMASGQSLFAVTSQGYPPVGDIWLSPDSGGTWKTIGPDLRPDSMVSCLAGSGPNVFAGISSRSWEKDEKREGVYLSPNNGRSWITVNSGLPPGVGVRHLAVIGQAVYAGTDAGIIYISKNNGASWEACSEGLPSGHPISCLVAAGQDLFAGIPQSSYELPTGPAAPANITLSVGGQYLFAMGPPPTGRLFLLAKGALKWNDTRIRLSRPVNSLAKIGTALFLGTDHGLYLCENYVESPRAFKLKMPQIISVSSLVAAGTDLFVGTSNGVIMVTKSENWWTTVDIGMPEKISITRLLLGGQDLFAGTEERGVWRLPLLELRKFRP